MRWRFVPGTVATAGIAVGPSAVAFSASAMAAGIEGSTIAAIATLVFTCGVSIAIIIAVLKGYNVEIKNGDLLLTLK